MPTSSCHVIPNVLWLCESAENVDTILDVGPGFGKYSVLLREYLNRKPTMIAAVEMWEPYVEAHRLKALYDKVIIGDVCELESFTGLDLVLMVDVIEHIEKKRALRLLDRIPGYVVICTPVDWFQNPEGVAVPPERHRSHWTLEDLEATGRLEAHMIDHGAHVARLARR